MKQDVDGRDKPGHDGQKRLDYMLTLTSSAKF